MIWDAALGMWLDLAGYEAPGRASRPKRCDLSDSVTEVSVRADMSSEVRSDVASLVGGGGSGSSDSSPPPPGCISMTLRSLKEWMRLGGMLPSTHFCVNLGLPP